MACIVDYFNKSQDVEIHETGVKSGDLFISYKSIFNDVRSCIEHIHSSTELQDKTVENLSKYVTKDPRLGTMLKRLRPHSKVFILTNSGYAYTNKIMTFLLEDPDKPDEKWQSYFDYILVDAGKPLFFEEGSLLRQVDMVTGSLAVGRHMGPLRPGHVYSGGSCDTFSDLIGARGRDVLYVGDHIFGDILKSKKKRGWRTYLVVPELHQELVVWTSKQELFEKIQQLDILMADTLGHLDSSSNMSDAQANEVEVIKKAHKHLSREMEKAYGLLGSCFRSGGRQTFFANQVQRYADLYAASCLNIMYYPYFYFFKAPSVLLPHEATVKHEDDYNPLVESSGGKLEQRRESVERERTFSMSRFHRTLSTGPDVEVQEKIGHAPVQAVPSDDEEEGGVSSRENSEEPEK